MNTIGLVREAIRIKDMDDARDHYWCVFDRDSFPAAHFNTALQMARAAGFDVAYSNEAFELWYLLHFDYIDSAHSRARYSEMLEARLSRPYKKNDTAMYESLLDLMPNALRNALKLRSTYHPHNPEKDNPSTTVDLLVAKLLALRASLSAPSSPPEHC